MSDAGQQPQVLAIQGEMTIYQAAELKQSLLAPLTRPGPLHVDLSKVTELDSAGVQLLMLVRKLADARQKPLRLIACSATVIEVLELLNLKSHLDGGSPSAPAQPDALAGGDPESVSP